MLDCAAQSQIHNNVTGEPGFTSTTETQAVQQEKWDQKSKQSRQV